MSIGKTDVDLIVSKMKDFSGAEIKSVCTEAGYFAIRANRSKVSQQDFLEAVEKVKIQEGVKYTRADYNKQVKTNIETQAVIDSVVKFITSHNYQDFPPVVALVEDATDQLGFAEEAKKKSETAAAKKDWQNAMLWANQWWQYQVKTADLGLRAKTYLEQHGAKKVK